MREIPQNDMRAATVTVANEGLPGLVERLNKESNVLKVEYVKVGQVCEVTVHFAVMDLGIQLAAIGHRIEEFANESNGDVHAYA